MRIMIFHEYGCLYMVGGKETAEHVAHFAIETLIQESSLKRKTMTEDQDFGRLDKRGSLKNGILEDFTFSSNVRLPF